MKTRDMFKMLETVAIVMLFVACDALLVPLPEEGDSLISKDILGVWSVIQVVESSDDGPKTMVFPMDLAADLNDDSDLDDDGDSDTFTMGQLVSIGETSMQLYFDITLIGLSEDQVSEGQGMGYPVISTGLYYMADGKSDYFINDNSGEISNITGKIHGMVARISGEDLILTGENIVVSLKRLDASALYGASIVSGLEADILNAVSGERNDVSASDIEGLWKMLRMREFREGEEERTNIFPMDLAEKITEDESGSSTSDIDKDGNQDIYTMGQYISIENSSIRTIYDMRLEGIDNADIPTLQANGVPVISTGLYYIAEDDMSFSIEHGELFDGKDYMRLNIIGDFLTVKGDGFEVVMKRSSDAITSAIEPVGSDLDALSKFARNDEESDNP